MSDTTIRDIFSHSHINLTIVARASAHNISDNARDVARAASDVEKAQATIGLKFKSFECRSVDMRGREVNVSFFERLIGMCHILLALCDERWVGSVSSRM